MEVEDSSSAASAAAELTADPKHASSLAVSSVVGAALAVQPLTARDLQAIVERSPGDGGTSAPPGLAAAVAHLMGDPWDTAAWARVLSEAKANGDFGRGAALRAMAKQFPSSGKVWHELLAFELERRDKLHAKEEEEDETKPKKEGDGDGDDSEAAAASSSSSSSSSEGSGGGEEAKETAAALDAKCDADWLQGMRLTGFANLDLWALDLERGLGAYEHAARERDAALANNRQVGE